MKLTESDISRIKYDNSDTFNLFGRMYIELFHIIPFRDLRIVARCINHDFPDFNITRVNPVVHFNNILDLSIVTS